MNRSLRELLNAVLIVLGILSAGMGLKGFLMSEQKKGTGKAPVKAGRE